jgi:hypothetical protein
MLAKKRKPNITMKMKQILVGIATLGVATMLLTSCDEVPQLEIDSANAAITETQLAGADVYVPQSFLALQDSMKVTLEGVEVQKAKFFKNFDASRTQLANILTQASTVKQETEAKIAAIKAEIATVTEEVNALIAANKELAAKAPKGKEGAVAIAAIQEEIAIIETSVTEATALSTSGQLIPSLDKLKAAKEKATSINTELTEVTAKYAASKKK